MIFLVLIPNWLRSLEQPSCFVSMKSSFTMNILLKTSEKSNFFIRRHFFLNYLNFLKSIQSENTQQLVKILEYLECPQYLRKSLFPPHKHLEHVGK
jgi:hypothetical protein